MVQIGDKMEFENGSTKFVRNVAKNGTIFLKGDKEAYYPDFKLGYGKVYVDKHGNHITRVPTQTEIAKKARIEIELKNKEIEEAAFKTRVDAGKIDFPEILKFMQETKSIGGSFFEINFHETALAMAQMTILGWKRASVADMSFKVKGQDVIIRTYMAEHGTWSGAGACTANGPHFHTVMLGPKAWLIENDDICLL